MNNILSDDDIRAEMSDQVHSFYKLFIKSYFEDWKWIQYAHTVCDDFYMISGFKNESYFKVYLRKDNFIFIFSNLGMPTVEIIKFKTK